MRTHGSYSCYVWGPEPGCKPGRGCRCDDCKAAVRAKAAADKRRTAPAYVGAARARAHVQWLAEHGVGLKTLAKVSGVSHGSLAKLVYGQGDRPPSRRIRPATEQAILAVRPDQGADGAYVDAGPYRDLLDTLRARGWTNTSIAAAIGCARGNLPARGEQVAAGRLRAVRALLDLEVPLPADRRGHNARAYDLALAWNTRDLDAEARETARKAAQAEERAAYRAKARAADDLPVIDLAALAAEEWRDRAACQFVPDDERWIFWPGKGDHQAVKAARDVCSSCPVAQECVEHAVALGEVGVWGGTTDMDRRHMRAGRIAVAPKVTPPPEDKRRPCGHCGELFLPWTSTTRFCSRSCAMRARAAS